MKSVITPYDVVTENYKAKRHVAMHLEGVASEKDVRAEIEQMSEAGTNTVLVTDEQWKRLEFVFAARRQEGVV